MKTRRFLITYAQNCTPVHAKFWASLQVAAKHRGAELLVIPGRYKNPTSRWSKAQEDQETWADEVTPYLYGRTVKLCRNLTLYADVSIQPTAARPLSSFEVFCGGASAIFGHPKRALETVPTGSRMPRVLTTTGACTLANYTKSKAGRKGQAHHTLGALVVEIEPDGTYHLRHVAGCPDGSFIDLAHEYTPEGVKAAPRAESINFGDIHDGKDDETAEAGHKALCDLIKPRYAFLHDTLDFHARNHHDKSIMGAATRIRKNRDSVQLEVSFASYRVWKLSQWGFVRTYVVRSNHDKAFERWLEECEPRKDAENAGYYYETWARMFRFHRDRGFWPMAFELEARRLFKGKLRTVRFLKEDETVKLKGVRHGFHGHNGVNGSRGSLLGYAKLGEKTVTGHGHAPGFVDGAARGGVFGSIDHGYNRLPSGWLVADVVQYGNGKRAVIILVNGRFTA